MTAILEDEPLEAWKKLKTFAESLGEQRIYCSKKSIMFARRVCYLFVRPKKKKIEICLFLDRKVTHSAFKEIKSYSKNRYSHVVEIYHEDSVEEPLTGWIQKAWELSGPN